MKANRTPRNFVTEEEAVSPVIAVILMVAITVVLAATVFVLVSDIGSQTGSTAPQIGFRVDDANDRLVVDSAASGADWNRLAIRLASAGTSTSIHVGSEATTPGVYQNEQGEDSTTNNALSTTDNLEVTGASDPIAASDFLDFCDAGAAEVADVTVQVIDTTANQGLGSWTFLTIGAC